MTAEISTQVAIIGGGPVGVGLAIELGQRGIRCVVIERYEQPQPIPKGQNLTQRTLEHFHFWGIEKELRAARTIPPSYGIGGLTAYGTLLGGYHYDWLQRHLVRPFYFTDNERLPQYATEAVLRSRAAALPSIKTLYGWTAEALTQDDAGVAVTITDRAGTRQSVRAAYAVGCDGSRSTTRTQAGITQTLSGHDRLMVLLVFRSEDLHRLLERYPGKSYYNVLDPALEGYWKFFGRVDFGSTWFFHAPVPPGTTKDNFDFRGFLHQTVGTEFAIEFTHIGFWDLRFAIADRYRSGRVFLAGDAAHSHPPYGGYGINTGFEDARNLGWKLALAFEGTAGPALLDSYDSERRPIFASTARDFIARSIETDREFLARFNPAHDRAAFDEAWRARQSGARDEVHAFEPHYEGSPIVFGPAGGETSALGSHMHAARPGHHLSPAMLSDGRNVYERVGDGFCLISPEADGACGQRFAAAAQRLGLALKLVQADEKTLAVYNTSNVLVRPDQFVAWASHDMDADANVILSRAVGLF